MAAQLFLLPFRPAIDANSLVIPGASLGFYLSGTLTKAPIYSDSQLQSPLANPVVANAAGVWPTIYFDTTITYRVILSSPDSVVLKEVDPYLPGTIDEITQDIKDLVASASGSATQAQQAAASVSATQTLLNNSKFDKLYPNLWPELLRFGVGDCVIDRTGLMGDGVNSIILPNVIEVRKGTTTYSGNPVQPHADSLTAQTSVIEGHLVLHYNPSVPEVIWYDASQNWYFHNTVPDFVANLSNSDVGRFDKAIIIAVVFDDKVISPVPFRNAGDGIASNLAAWGADVTLAPYRYASNTVISVSDSVLTSRGITKAVQGSTNRTTYVGPSGLSVKQGARVYIRAWVVSSEDNQFTTQGTINIWTGFPEGSSYVGGAVAKLERIWSPRVRTYVASFLAPSGMGGFSFGVDATGVSSSTANQAIAGLQYAGGDSSPHWIRTDDFTPPATGGLVDVDATFPPAIYLRSGRPLDFNAGNALSDLQKMQNLVVSVASVGSRGNRPLVKSSKNTIELDPSRMGSTITVNFQDTSVSGNSVNPWKTQTLGVVQGSRTDAQVGLILTDSKGQQSLASDLKAKYEAVAGSGKLTMIGTIPDGDNASVKTEGHRGWGVADITYDRTQYPPTPLGSRVPGYSQNTPDGTPDSNVFIWPNDGSYQPNVVRNGYAFDLRKYLTAFAFPDPNFVVIELGVNDFGPNQNDDDLGTVLTRNWQILYQQTRAALPNARIIFMQWSLGHQDFLGTANPLRYSRFHKFLIRQQRQFVTGLNDSNCILVGTYLHVDRLIDYPPYLNSTDAYGLQTVQGYNALHEDSANRSAGAEAILGAISY